MAHLTLELTVMANTRRCGEGVLPSFVCLTITVCTIAVGRSVCLAQEQVPDTDHSIQGLRTAVLSRNEEDEGGVGQAAPHTLPFRH